MKQVIVVFCVFCLSLSAQQVVPVTNENQASNSETTIDGSLPGQGIPKALVDLFPQIDETTTTKKPRKSWQPTAPDDERIPPAFRHLYEESAKNASTSETTIDGSLPGQGIPKDLVDLFPQIEETTTTKRPRRPWRPTVPDDERIPPAFRHLYPDPNQNVESSTSETQEEGKTEILLTTTPHYVPCNRHRIMQVTTASTTTTKKPRRRMRPGRRRRPPYRDPAARARARQRAMEMDMRIPPAFAHLYTTAAPLNQTTALPSNTTEMSLISPAASKKSSKAPQTTTAVVEEEIDEPSARMGPGRRRYQQPDDERIPPAYRHHYPDPSASNTTESAITTVRATHVQTRKPTVPETSFTDKDRKLLTELSDQFKLLVRLEDQHLKKLDSMENRLKTIEENFGTRLESLQKKLQSIIEQLASLEDQKRRVDSALYLVRKNFSQIKSEMKEKSNSTDSHMLNDLMKRMTLISNMVEDIQNRIDRTRLRKSLPSNSIQLNSSSITSAENDLEENKNLEPFPENCLDVRNSGHEKTDVYRIYPRQSSMSFYVLCEKGWTVIQNRNSSNVSFKRGWDDYRLGFGNLADEFWLGLEKIHILTNLVPAELLIELEDFNSQKRYAYYSRFSIGSESEGYSLNLLGYFDGNAGDSLKYHAGQKFSTFDRDHDSALDNCAQIYGGGWWYKDCGMSDLNGLYGKGEKGMHWKTFLNGTSTLKSSRILIRPVNKA